EGCAVLCELGTGLPRDQADIGDRSSFLRMSRRWCRFRRACDRRWKARAGSAPSERFQNMAAVDPAHEVSWSTNENCGHPAALAAGPRWKDIKRWCVKSGRIGPAWARGDGLPALWRVKPGGIDRSSYLKTSFLGGRSRYVKQGGRKAGANKFLAPNYK